MRQRWICEMHDLRDNGKSCQLVKSRSSDTDAARLQDDGYHDISMSCRID